MWFASPRWLLAIAFALIVPGLFWGLPSAVTAQVDAPVPLGPLYFFAQYHNPQIDTIYPAFHQLLLLPLYAARHRCLLGHGRYFTSLIRLALWDA
jgi:hypothetical protein